MESRSILVVEDAEAFASALTAALTDAGHRVTYARNGAEADAALAAQPFDLVITDIIMPGQDGFEVIEHVRRIQPAARIFAMSGGGKLYSAHACLEAAEGSGIDAVFLKPFSFETLLARMRTLFAS